MFRTLSKIIPSAVVRSLSAPSLARSASTADNIGERVLAIALGSNLGDKVRNIETALRMLETQHGIRVVDTSFLYESSPMYMPDQPHFVNGACLISTTMDAQRLLGVLKDVEESVGRTPNIQNGPRVVDLDILFDGSRTYYLHGIPGRELQVPHPRMQEREFVLRPLADIAPTFLHPVLGRTIRELLGSIRRDKTLIRKIICFPSRPYNEPPTLSDPEPVFWSWGTKTYLMATLNTTPDSFSDGGDHFSMPAATSYARSAVEAGADILDIGGYSTRPGSGFISPEEEIKRTVPFIHAIRKYQENLPQISISVDTFRADVAEAAISAGANCINDVYALTGPHVGVANVSVDEAVKDQDEIEVSDGGAMLRTATRLGVPVILMHSRGLADKNKDYSMYSGGVMEGVKKELGLRVQRALRAGVRRWNIILDPGIGFSKGIKDNLELMRRGAELNAAALEERKRPDHELPITAKAGLEGYPVLVGTSRKAYLGGLTGKTTAKDREWATAAAISAAIQQNADIIRVHKVDAHKDVLVISDAIYRTSQ